jgi:hypothetical protein
MRFALIAASSASAHARPDCQSSNQNHRGAATFPRAARESKKCSNCRRTRRGSRQLSVGILRPLPTMGCAPFQHYRYLRVPRHHGAHRARARQSSMAQGTRSNHSWPGGQELTHLLLRHAHRAGRWLPSCPCVRRARSVSCGVAMGGCRKMVPFRFGYMTHEPVDGPLMSQ